MEPIADPRRLNAATWGACDNLDVFGLFFADRELCPDPPSERRLRLMVCAALRSIWPHLAPEVQRVVEGIEYFADHGGFADDPLNGPGKPREVLEHWLDVTPGPGLEGWHRSAGWAAWYAGDPVSLNQVAMSEAAWVSHVYDTLETFDSTAPVDVDYLGIFFDLFANPFLPAPDFAAWRTPTAASLAAGAYADRAWHRLPVLADALEEAGCADARVLDHLRGPGPHARGCWVLDGVLGKD